MAAITAVTGSPHPTFVLIRTAAAQATTGQTDWVSVPSWARSATVYFNLTANAGTTPISTVSFLSVPPGIFDDTDSVAIGTGAAITAASQHRYNIAPGVTGIADGTDQAAADASVGINSPLPPLLGVKVLNDRTTGDETYTYTLNIEFRG